MAQMKLMPSQPVKNSAVVDFNAVVQDGGDAARLRESFGQGWSSYAHWLIPLR